MSESTQRLLNRLQTAQRELILATAAAESIPPDSVIRKIAALEVAICAIEQLAQSRSKDLPAAAGPGVADS